jgi:TatD DNase family protein
VVFAVTRTLAEASWVPHGLHPQLVWGLGVHPADASALAGYEPGRFDQLLPKFALVGEIGLDRRSGNLDRQREVLDDILGRLSGERVMLSIHSTGMTEEILTFLEQHRPEGPILHWFIGTPREIARAESAGAWFSVNARATDEALVAIPRDRILTETDFPFTRRQGSTRPGASEPIETRLGQVWGCSAVDARRQVWRNLAALVQRCRPTGLPQGISAVLKRV